MNKTQSIIFVISVLLVSIAGNWIYNNKPKDKRDVKRLPIVLPFVYDLNRIQVNDLEFKYHHDTLYLQYCDYSDTSAVTKTVYYFVELTTEQLEQFK